MILVDLLHKALAWSVKSLFFLSAYAPLGAILAVLLWPESRLSSIVIAVIVVVSLGLMFLFVRELKNSAPVELTVEQIQRRDGDIVSYIVTYAIPFLAVPFESTEIGIGLGVFFVVVWFLQVKLNLLHINPVLAIFNYHLYEVTTGGTVQILLSKKRRSSTGKIFVAKAGDYVLFEVKPL